MDDTIRLYSFVRSGDSIYLARVEEVSIRPDPIRGQAVVVRSRVEQTLWGKTDIAILESEFHRPVDENARLKFPHPIWGRIDPRPDLRLFLVIPEPREVPVKPVYVEEVVDSNDAELTTISNILGQEKLEHEPSARKARYLAYLTGRDTVEKLFGAEALAKDWDLPAVDESGGVAVAMSAIFDSNETLFVRLSVGTWMWECIYARTNVEGKVAAINATIKGMEDTSEDVRRFSRDHLTGIDADDLRQPGVVASATTVTLLQERLSEETSVEVQDNLKKMISALGE